MPNRILPLYRLMLLYSDTGQADNAERTAKQIISIKPKVESPATEEIKEKAIQLLDGIINDGNPKYETKNTNEYIYQK